ncbi:MAG: hypothetical protein EAX96_15105 [Candidatus Lokiarchaeota archaeon]|nr:hypothetical protein [Candidatus Lokiarchaeota archaeon]
MADKEWDLKFADVELDGNTFIVNSQINYKDLEKDHKDQIKKLNKDSQNTLKELFAKKRIKEEEVNNISKQELIIFFDTLTGKKPAPAATVAATTSTERAAYRDVDVRDDLKNKFDVRVDERLEIKSKHDGEIAESTISGLLRVMNNGNKNRIWDIDIELTDSEKTNLEEKKIHILDLDPQEDWAQDYTIDVKEVKTPLQIEEEINATPEAEEASQTFVLNQEHEPLFKIILNNTSEAAINDIELIKDIPSVFDKLSNINESIGKAKKDGDKLRWEIEELNSGQSATLEFTMKITPDGKEPISSGQIEVKYSILGNTFSGMDVDYVDGYTDNIYYVDRDERDEEPDVWDCKFIFKNRSEFPIKLIDVDLRAGDYNTEEQVVDLGPQLDPDVILNPGEEWESQSWSIESEDLPKFGKNVQFTIIGDVVNQLSATVMIEPIEMPVFSLEGKKEFSETEIASYRETEIVATTTVNATGSASVEKFHIEDKVPTHFIVEDTEKVKITVNGKELDHSKMSFSFKPSQESEATKTMNIDVEGILDQVGPLVDEATIILTYPLKAVNPVVGDEIEAGVLFQAITEDGSVIELLIESPLTELVIVQVRRRVTDGRIIQQGRTKGQYNIIIIHKNRGDAAEVNKVFEEIIPENFSLISANPEPEKAGDKLTWTFEEIKPDEEIEIEFTIEGSGDYKARDAQKSFRG